MEDQKSTVPTLEEGTEEKGKDPNILQGGLVKVAVSSCIARQAVSNVKQRQKLTGTEEEDVSEETSLLADDEQECVDEGVLHGVSERAGDGGMNEGFWNQDGPRREDGINTEQWKGESIPSLGGYVFEQKQETGKTTKKLLDIPLGIYTGEKWDYSSESAKNSCLSKNSAEFPALHTEGKLYPNLECRKSLSWSSQFIRHQPVHTGGKPYECEGCGKSYSDQSHLNEHKRIHTGEGTYKCSMCGTSFHEKLHLSIHKKIHTGQKPYKCSECEESFSWSTSFKIHQTTHKRERLQQCSGCCKSFDDKSGLDEHERTHPRKSP